MLARHVARVGGAEGRGNKEPEEFQGPHTEVVKFGRGKKTDQDPESTE